MSIVQDTYKSAPAKGFAGQPANAEPSGRISRTIEDAAGIGFGAPVFRGSADGGCTGTGAAGKDLGFCIADQGLQILPGGTADTFPQYQNVPIQTRGAIMVNVTGAVTPGQAVTVGIGADASDGIGSTAADATHIAMTGWVFDETVTDDLCVVVKR